MLLLEENMVKIKIYKVDTQAKFQGLHPHVCYQSIK